MTPFALGTRALQRLPPEMAHRLALLALAGGPRVRIEVPTSPRLATRIFGRSLPHPLGLAAGFDKNAEAVPGLFALGFSFVEVGTVTPRPQAGNPKPRLFRLPAEAALINRMGFNNQGLERVAARLAALSALPGPLGVNLGINKDEPDPTAAYLQGLRTLHARADYLVLNVSSPNTPGLRRLQGREALRDLLNALLAARAALPGPAAPLLVKIAPDLAPADQEDIAEVALATGIDGLIVANTTLARPPHLTGPHAAEGGGLSGPPLFAGSTALLANMYRLTGGRLPLIGAGGIASAADALAKLRAGASALQLYTALVYQGPDVVRRIVTGLDHLLAQEGIAALDDIVGRDAGSAEVR